MYKYLKNKTFQRLQKAIPSFPSIYRAKLVQYITLKTNNKINEQFEWIIHRQRNEIYQSDYIINKMGLQTQFKNQIVGWQQFNRRIYDPKQFLSNDIQDLYYIYYRTTPEKISQNIQNKPNQNKVIYTFTQNFDPTSIFNINYAKRKYLNKVICFPQAQLANLQITKDIQQYSLNHNIKFLPMKDPNLVNILTYIRRSQVGNVLINEFGENMQYITTEARPYFIFLFCENSEMINQTNVQRFIDFNIILKYYELKHKAKLNQNWSLLTLRDRRITSIYE